MQSNHCPSFRSSFCRPIQLSQLLLSTTIVFLITCWVQVHRVSSFFQPIRSHSSSHSRHILPGGGKSLFLPHLSSSTSYMMDQSKDSSWTRIEGDPHVETILFVECGFGNDSHGQNVTKAAGKRTCSLFIYILFFGHPFRR